MNSDATQDEIAIRALVAAYNDAVNRGDLEGMVAVYAEDGVLHPFGGKEYIGHAQIREVIGGSVGHYAFVFQMTHAGLVKVDGDSGTGRFWISEYGQPADGSPATQFMGLYQDRYVRTPGGWRFARRQLDATFRGRVKLEGKMPARPAYLPGLGPPA
ncbi:MAG: nuclear transport factor 2 family protein [Gammaproteobacteria bacterium]